MTAIEKKPLFHESIVIDGCAPLASWQNYRLKGYEFYCDCGVTAICATVLPIGGYLAETVKGINEWYERFRSDEKLMQVLTVDDIYRAQKENKLGVILSFQGTSHLQASLDMIEFYYRLGVRQMLLCYNEKNSIGDGCTEPKNEGLSIFGEKAVKEMNRVGVIVDVSHTGHRTSMEALECSTDPVTFSHGNSYSVHPSGRNLRDDQVIACANTGGIIGVNAYSSFVSAKSGKEQTVYDVIDHIDYYVNLVGIDHVSFGIDYFQMQYGVMTKEESLAEYNSWIEKSLWDKNVYPEPPYYYPSEIRLPNDLHNIVPAMKERGYADSDIVKVLGENYVRIAKEVWK